MPQENLHKWLIVILMLCIDKDTSQFILLLCSFSQSHKNTTYFSSFNAVSLNFWVQKKRCYTCTLHSLCADGVVVIAISLFPEVPGSIPERGKKRRFLWIRLFVHAVHLLSFLWRSDPSRGVYNSALASHPRMGQSHIILFTLWHSITFGGELRPE